MWTIIFFFKIFFWTFLLRWKPILKKEKKNVFIYFSDLRSFLRVFSTKMLFKIFTSKWGQILPNLARMHYFWCFSIKNIKTWKKKLFWHFFGKINFFSFFEFPKIFWDRIFTKKFFFYIFLLTRSQTTILCKKIWKKTLSAVWTNSTLILYF